MPPKAHYNDDTPDDDKCELVWKLVTGNGDPADGLVYKVAEMRQSIDQIQESVREFRVLLRTILGGVIVGVALSLIKSV